MTTFRVEVEANTKPTVCVDFDHEPTEDEIDAAINELATGVLDIECYLAEFIVEAGYIVTEIERYG